MIKINIMYMGQPATAACDELCCKAWGSHSRPKRFLDEDGDDFKYISDDEFDIAPCPDTVEGWESKPQSIKDRLNKWCVRECERCYMGPPNQEIVWPTFPKIPNYKLGKMAVQNRLEAI
jgi:hypothetical protein